MTPRIPLIALGQSFAYFFLLNVKMGRAILTLLCLWSCIITVTPLTDTQVHRATEHIKNHFKLAKAKQHAYVALFSKEECDSLSSNNNILQILKKEKANEITEALNNDDKIYQGSQMVFATYKKEEEKNFQIHSEYRLLFPQQKNKDSPVKNLMNKNPGAVCAIFYTLNSPCLGKCANPGNPRNIIEKLLDFHTFEHNKAFVYQQLFYWDVNNKGKDDIWDGLTQVNNNIDVYRCSLNKCLKCFEKKENKLQNKDDCLN